MSTEPRRVRIARIDPAAQDQSILSLEHEAALQAGHTRPGQYCELTVDAPGAKPVQGFFVLIDPPGTGPARFLLSAGGPAADALRRLPAGTTVLARGPLGEGFPIEHAQGRDVLLVSAGSAIGAIRPLLLGLMPPTARRVWFYHGARTLAHVPFREDLERAHAHGARVTVTVSREGPYKSTPAGRVQAAIERDKLDLGNAVAFIAGMGEMVEALKAMLPKFGLPAERVYLNY